MNFYFFFIFVIPAKAGIHILHGVIEEMDSRLRGNDGAYWFLDVVVEKDA